MTRYFLFILLITCNLLSYGQAPKYQTYSANLLIIATKEGGNYQWQNKNITVTLNLPAFKGYDNEVEIRLVFNAFWTGE